MFHTPSLSRRGFLAAAGSVLAAPRALAGAPERPVVIELFTSQGCSSCPRADALFAELCADPGVLALSYHVDYWDYLGWKDTLGSPEFSQRHYDYARARGDMNVYTPQMIVDGRSAVVGSNRTEVDRAITVAALSPLHVPLRLIDSGEELTIVAEAAELGHEIDVERARRALERAQKRMAASKTELIDWARAEAALRRSLMRAKVAGR